MIIIAALILNLLFTRMPIAGFKWRVIGNSWSGGASYGIFESQSWSGGASYGVFESQSWSGGGSVSGISFKPAGGSYFGVFVKCTSYPVSQTTIYDVDAGLNGYERTSLKSDGHVIAEYHNAGVTHTFDFGVLPLNQWCWVTTGSSIDSGNNDNCRCTSTLYNGAGVAIASENPSVTNFATNRVTNFTAILSIGLSGSGGYANAPNDATLKFTKFRHNDSNAGMPFPSSDVSSDLNDYMSRQTIGSASTLTDTGTANQSLTAGVNGLTINLDGPYP